MFRTKKYLNNEKPKGSAAITSLIPVAAGGIVTQPAVNLDTKCFSVTDYCWCYIWEAQPVKLSLDRLHRRTELKYMTFKTSLNPLDYYYFQDGSQQPHKRGSNKNHKLTKNLLVNSRKWGDDESPTQPWQREERSSVSVQEGTVWLKTKLKGISDLADQLN